MAAFSSQPPVAAAMRRFYGQITRLAHSSPWRSAAAAANGPITRLISVRAHRIMNGAPNGTGPMIAAFGGGDAENQHRNGERQHQHRQQQAAAPQRDRERRADQADEGERRRADQQRERDGADRQRVEIEQQPEHRRRDHQRQAGGDPMGEGLGGTASSSGGRPSAGDRASRPRGRRRTGGRARAARRAVRRATGSPGRSAQQREIGADRERHQGHDDQEEQHAHQRAAADAHRDAHVAQQEGAERVHGAPAGSPSAVGRGPVGETGTVRREPTVLGSRAHRNSFARPIRAAHASPRDESAAREVPPHQVGEPRLARGIERGGGLVEQPDRAWRRDQAGDAKAGAAARPTGSRPAGRRGRRGRPPRASAACDDASLPPKTHTRIARFSSTDRAGLRASRWPI